MYQPPHLEICYGPMKSGKSRYLIEKAEALHAANIPFLAFKPRQDTRDGHLIRSRDPRCRHVEALSVVHSCEILPLMAQVGGRASSPADPTYLALSSCLPPGALPAACLIDEVFLFDAGLLTVLSHLRAAGVLIFLSGLDRDFRREYFPLRDSDQGQSMRDLIGLADHRIALTATCERCGAPAAYTQRLVNGQPAHYESPTILIGDEEYQPRCQSHHEVLGHPCVSLAG